MAQVTCRPLVGPGVPLTSSPHVCCRVVVLSGSLLASESKIQGQVLGQCPLTCILSDLCDATCSQQLPLKAAYWISGCPAAPQWAKGRLSPACCLRVLFPLELAFETCRVLLGRDAAPQKCVSLSFC